MPGDERAEQRVFPDLADGLLVALGHIWAGVELGPVDLRERVSASLRLRSCWAVGRGRESRTYIEHAVLEDEASGPGAHQGPEDDEQAHRQDC